MNGSSPETTCLKELVRQAFAHGTVVYDEDSQKSAFTNRLMEIVVTVMQSKWGEMPRTLMVPRDQCWREIPGGLINLVGGLMYGMEVKDLDEKAAVEEYMRLNGTFPHWTSSLIIAISHSGKVLLGAY